MSIFSEPRVDTREPPIEVPVPPGRGRRWLMRSLAVLTALVLVCGATVGIYTHVVARAFDDNIQRQALLPSDQDDSVQLAGNDPSGPARRPAPGGTDAVNYVLMGSDSRDAADAGAGRSDVLMVLHLDADREQAYLISFPRDMYVSIPGYGRNKINAAYAFGGAALTVRTLENLLDVRMDHVALIDFDGLHEADRRPGRCGGLQQARVEIAGLHVSQGPDHICRVTRRWRSSASATTSPTVTSTERSGSGWSSRPSCAKA